MAGRERLEQRPGEPERTRRQGTDGSTVRIQKIIAKAGLASRREAEQWMRERRVTVNGRIVDRLGTLAEPGKDHICVDGKLLQVPAAKAYFAFHKPAGVVSTMKDDKERPAVADFLSGRQRRQGVFPIGRLDYNSSGLLLLTNDGPLAHRLMHPRFGVKKVYRVKLNGVPAERQLDRVRRGIRLSDGRTGPAEVRVLRKLKRKAWVEVAIREGRYREVRRMMEAIGQRVEKLVRCQVGPIALDGLSVGESRALSAEEARQIQHLVGLGADPEKRSTTGRARRKALARVK